jgi:hypothetical protein
MEKRLRPFITICLRPFYPVELAAGSSDSTNKSDLTEGKDEPHIRKADCYGNLAGLSKHPRSRQTSRRIAHGRAEQIKKMET